MQRQTLLSTPSRKILARGVPKRDPAIDAMAQAVRAITDLITHQSLVGFDFRDTRLVLGNGGRAVFGERIGLRPCQAKARLPLDMPRLTARP